MSEKGLKRGQPITFRIPSDTSDHTLRQLQKLKETERRNFSSKIAEFVIEGVNDSLIKQREAITIPLPRGLDKSQRDWLKHEHSEALLGSIVYQLLSDPIRAAALLASLNSNALDVDDALYLQEEAGALFDSQPKEIPTNIDRKFPDIETSEPQFSISDDDLDNFDWENASENKTLSIEEEAIEEDPLSDFLAQMNK
ncbi:hypothetical protein [Pseudogracilibacillus auburnensis]|uniref:hypothetical protein n=1 Tax=Pseudogracilibacillus auburnensis TaxID=1494959 RepID=UPI001A95AC95|nr:hypothetical protein [Pseudogracilibacillus auburnensis]MBO1004842.1 hypothetical protein [Pseudogracilibacillus auburnensis]